MLLNNIEGSVRELFDYWIEILVIHETLKNNNIVNKKLRIGLFNLLYHNVSRQSMIFTQMTGVSYSLNIKMFICYEVLT